MAPRESPLKAAQPPFDARRFSWEFLAATGVFLAAVALTFRQTLLGGPVHGFGQNPSPEKGMLGIYEMVYQCIPLIRTGAQIIQDGFPPLWTPYTEGGTPLLGKMMSSVLSPYHILYYILPLRWLPHLLTLVLVLKGFFGYSFAYLYGRALRLGFPAAAGAALLFLYVDVLQGGLYPITGSALHVPVLLLLTEVYFRGGRRAALYLLPWGFALPFLNAHFEVAARMQVSAAVYLLFRMAWERPPLGRRRCLAEFALCAAAGWAAAAPQLWSAKEYVDLSYVNVWRHLPEFGWIYQTIGKRLAAADLAALALGWGAGAGAFLLARGRGFDRRGLALRAGAAACLAVAVACLSWAGLDASLESAVPYRGGRWGWLAGAAALSLAFWGLRGRWQEPGARALGLLMAGSLLVLAKTPPLSNLLSWLPLFGSFNNTVYAQEFELARAILCAAALERAFSAAVPWAERRREAAGLLLAAATLLAGYAGSRPLARAAARWLPGGAQAAAGGGAGFLGPERAVTFAGSYLAAGRLPAYPRPASVLVGDVAEGRLKEPVEARLLPSGGGTRFVAEVPLPSREGGVARLGAHARYADGGSRSFVGPTVRRAGAYAPWMMAAALLAPALLALGGPWLAGPCAALLLLLGWTRFGFYPVPAEQIPFRLPGVESLREDPGLFRVTAFSGDLLSADYLNLYGLQELRNGGDNLDVLPMIYFLFFSNSLAGSPDSRDLGLRLWGLANAKYILDLPGAARDSPLLERLREGPDLSVFRNRAFRERARFFERAVLAPLPDLWDWSRRGRTFGAVAEALKRPDFDLDSTLLLHERPGPEPPPAAAPPAGGPPVLVEAYEPDRVALSVDAPRPGFVLLADNHFPGWKALLNGAPAPILRGWLTFRAVRVPAGRSRLEFVYRPAALLALLALSAALSLAWLAAYLAFRLGRPAAPDKRPAKASRLAAAQGPPADPLALACGSWLEGLVVAAVGPWLLFWLLWTALVWRGPGAVRAAAWGALGAVALWGLRLAAAKRPTPGS